MNSTPSPFFTRFRHHLPWSACLGILLALHTVPAQQEVTSFEESEGFSDGMVLPGRAGWEGSPGGAALGNLVATGEEAYRGSQSLKANNATGSYTFAQSPDLLKRKFTGLTFFLKNPETQYLEADQVIGRWEVMLGDSGSPATSRIVMHLRYTSAKALHINLSSPGEEADHWGNRNILGASAVKLEAWTEVALKFDFAAAELWIFVNGKKVSSVVRLNPEKVPASSRISGIRFATPSSASAGVTYYDFVTGQTGGSTPPEPDSTGQPR